MCLWVCGCSSPFCSTPTSQDPQQRSPAAPCAHASGNWWQINVMLPSQDPQVMAPSMEGQGEQLSPGTSILTCRLLGIRETTSLLPPTGPGDRVATAGGTCHGGCVGIGTTLFAGRSPHQTEPTVTICPPLCQLTGGRTAQPSI